TPAPQPAGSRDEKAQIRRHGSARSGAAAAKTPLPTVGSRSALAPHTVPATAAPATGSAPYDMGLSRRGPPGAGPRCNEQRLEPTCRLRTIKCILGESCSFAGRWSPLRGSSKPCPTRSFRGSLQGEGLAAGEPFDLTSPIQ